MTRLPNVHTSPMARRTTQPYRRSGAREPSPVLDAMMRGRGPYDHRQPKRKRKRKPGALTRRVAALKRRSQPF
jgi:hypothetical protein